MTGPFGTVFRYVKRNPSYLLFSSGYKRVCQRHFEQDVKLSVQSNSFGEYWKKLVLDCSELDEHFRKGSRFLGLRVNWTRMSFVTWTSRRMHPDLPHCLDGGLFLTFPSLLVSYICQKNKSLEVKDTVRCLWPWNSLSSFLSVETGGYVSVATISKQTASLSNVQNTYRLNYQSVGSNDCFW
jgi:hypothetical protein